jgi:hypothetical protein
MSCSCSCDYEPVAWWDSSIHKSRKVRRCVECSGNIAIGEQYVDLRYVDLDGEFRWITQCRGCNDLMQFFCLPFEGVMEELNPETVRYLTACGPSCGEEEENDEIKVMGPAGRAKLNALWWQHGGPRRSHEALADRYTPERWRRP